MSKKIEMAYFLLHDTASNLENDMFPRFLSFFSTFFDGPFYFYLPLLIFLVVGTFFLGAFLLSLMEKSFERSFIMGVSPIIGLAAFSIWLNSFSRIISWESALLSWLFICIFTIKAGWIAWKFAPLDDDWYALKKLVLWISIPFVLFAFIGQPFDHGWHLAISTLTANNGWPISFPYDPTEPLTYHFGFDLIAAAFIKLGLYPGLASSLLLVILQLSLIVIVFLFLKKWLPSIRYRLLAIGLWYFAESFGWLVRPFRAWLPHSLQKLPPFSSLIVHSVGLTTLMFSGLIAMATVFLVPLIMRRPEPKSISWFFVIGLLIASSSLSSETLLTTVITGLLIGTFFSLKTTKEKRIYLLGLCIMGFLIALQGGLLSQFVSKFLLGVAAFQPETEIHLRTSTFLTIFGGEILDLRSIWSWIRLTLEMGPQLFLFFLACIHWKKWNAIEQGGLLGAVSAMLFPFLFFYPPTPVNILRMFQNAFLFTNLLGAIILFERNTKKSFKLIIAILLSLSGLIAFLFHSFPSLAPSMSHTGPTISVAAFWLPYLRRDWLPPKSIVWVSIVRANPSWPTREIGQIPFVFGSPIKYCSTYALTTINQTCDAFFTNPSLHLNFLSDQIHPITHLLLTPDWISRHNQEPWFQHLTYQKSFLVPQWISRFNVGSSFTQETFYLYSVQP